MSTAEKINATRMAKQQTRAKITMHFCCDCRRQSERRWWKVREAALAVETQDLTAFQNSMKILWETIMSSLPERGCSLLNILIPQHNLWHLPPQHVWPYSVINSSTVSRLPNELALVANQKQFGKVPYKTHGWLQTKKAAQRGSIMVSGSCDDHHLPTSMQNALKLYPEFAFPIAFLSKTIMVMASEWMLLDGQFVCCTLISSIYQMLASWVI